MSPHETYMRRCLQLARLATGNVAPNPVVGAVLVYENRIIGEGYHQQYGGSHAEVNCIESVNPEEKPLTPSSTLYVSLEPCAHWGKTPPCVDLILKHKIPAVVIGCRDPFAEVDGKGIQKLKAAGVDVTVGVLEEECREINKRFFTFHQFKRPYVLLKWAQTANGKIGWEGKRLHISNAYTNRLVHKWRSEEAAILVGTNTALHDDPQLTTRLWPGHHPIRTVIDKNLRLPSSLKLFDGSVPTIVFNNHEHRLSTEKVSPQTLTGVHYYQVADDASFIHQLLNGFYALNIQSVMVEGGTMLLQSFIDEGLWDEARMITNEAMVSGDGSSAPRLMNYHMVETKTFGSDVIRFYTPLASA